MWQIYVLQHVFLHRYLFELIDDVNLIQRIPNEKSRGSSLYFLFYRY